MLLRLLARTGLRTPVQQAWGWYDWANSAYFTTVLTAVFPAFFATYAAADLPPAEATQRFAIATSLSAALIAVLSPVLGALADEHGIRKRLLGVSLAVGAVACLSLAAIDRGAWRFALAAFIIGNVGASAALVFYDSLLPFVSTREDADRVSAAGYALGYAGGGLLLVLNLAWVLQPTAFGFADAALATKASFVSVAVWWALFSLPLFRRVPEPSPRVAGQTGGREGPPYEEVPRPKGWGGPLRPITSEGRLRSALIRPFLRLGETLREVRRYRNAFLLFLAMLLYQDGIQTIIRMASVYGAEIGIGQTAQIGAFVMVQFLGIPFAFLFGWLGTRIGAKRAIYIALAVYTVATLLGFFMTTVTEFFLLAGLVASVQGGSQALSRSLFSRLIPARKSSEFFGFYAVAERFATVLGPLVFGASVAITGSSRSAVLAIVLFFIAGAALLALVNEEEGICAALET